MQDTIIKGTGNSRTLKSVSNFTSLYPTYDAFAAALVAGTLPIDIGALVAAGVSQTGTALNKASLLTDTTATNLGLTSTATLNNALNKLRLLIEALDTEVGERAEVVTGEYIGTGKFGVSNPNRLTFSFAPKIAGIPANVTTDNTSFSFHPPMQGYFWLLQSNELTTSYQELRGFGIVSGSSTIYGRKSSDGKTIEWYSSSDYYNQFNNSNRKYYYFAIG